MVARLLAGLVVATGLAACGSGDALSPETLPPIAPLTSFIVITEPPTTLAQVPAHLIDDCVAYVQFGAYVGNSLLADMWDNAGQNVDNLRSDCEFLGRRDVGALTELSRQWIEAQAGLGSPTTDAPTTGTTP